MISFYIYSSLSAPRRLCLSMPLLCVWINERRIAGTTSSNHEPRSLRARTIDAVTLDEVRHRQDQRKSAT